MAVNATEFKPANIGTFEGDPSADTLFESFDQLNFDVEYLNNRIDLIPQIEGPEGPQGPAGPTGPQGVGIETAQIVDEDLIITLTNGTPLDAGRVVGPQGPAGTDGTNGNDGANGLSAYEIAVEDGFVGNEEDWLASLVGPQGPPGPAGGIQSIIAGTNITIDDTDPENPIISAEGGGGEGTVTSVGVSVPTGLSASGSPVTASGTIAITYASGYQGYTTAEASKLSGIATGATANTGTVTSVALSLPTGLSVSGSPVTASGTFTVTWASGYQGYTTTEATKLSGLTIGSTVQAYSAKLAALAGQTWAADRYTYYTSASAVAIGTLTSFGRSLIDDADAAAARTTLGLGSLATLSAINNANWSGTALSIANGGTGQTTAANAFNAIKQAATTSATGVVELATDAEMTAGTATGVIPDVKQVADYVASKAGIPTTYGAIGTYVIAASSDWATTTGYDEGGTYAGSTLYRDGSVTSGNNDASINIGVSAPSGSATIIVNPSSWVNLGLSGTWRLMTRVYRGNSATRSPVGLFMRVA